MKLAVRTATAVFSFVLVGGAFTGAFTGTWVDGPDLVPTAEAADGCEGQCNYTNESCVKQCVDVQKPCFDKCNVDKTDASKLTAKGKACLASCARQSIPCRNGCAAQRGACATRCG